MKNEFAMQDRKPLLGSIALRFGLAMEELEHLLSGPVQDLFARIVRFNSQPQRQHRVNTVLLYASLIDACSIREEAVLRPAPSPE